MQFLYNHQSSGIQQSKCFCSLLECSLVECTCVLLWYNVIFYVIHRNTQCHGWPWVPDTAGGGGGPIYGHPSTTLVFVFCISLSFCIWIQQQKIPYLGMCLPILSSLLMYSVTKITRRDWEHQKYQFTHILAPWYRYAPSFAYNNQGIIRMVMMTILMMMVMTILLMMMMMMTRRMWGI